MDDQCRHEDFYLDKEHRITDNASGRSEYNVFYKVCKKCGNIEEVTPVRSGPNLEDSNLGIPIVIWGIIIVAYGPVARIFSLPYTIEILILLFCFMIGSLVYLRWRSEKARKSRGC